MVEQTGNCWNEIPGNPLDNLRLRLALVRLALQRKWWRPVLSIVRPFHLILYSITQTKVKCELMYSIYHAFVARWDASEQRRGTLASSRSSPTTVLRRVGCATLWILTQARNIPASAHCVALTPLQNYTTRKIIYIYIYFFRVLSYSHAFRCIFMNYTYNSAKYHCVL